MENLGWIKLHNKFLKWEWIDNPSMVALFIHLLLNANYQEKNWHGQIIKPGQLIFGRKAMAKRTGLSEQTIRTCITKLKSTNEITSETNYQYTIITIVNWHKYQQKKEPNQPTNQPTINQRSTTPKEYKNIKNRIQATEVARVSKVDTEDTPTKEIQEEPFNFASYLDGMRSDSRKGIRIIRAYWIEKEYRMETLKQTEAQIKRDIRAANNLVEYSEERIMQVMEFCSREYPKIWTLETVGKKINESYI